jgi:MPBQ/MSBQ methyltransferase
MLFYNLVGILALVLSFIAAIFVLAHFWLASNRRYQSSNSVVEAYDRWTEDALLERLWGDHVHLGFYGNPPRDRDFRSAKDDFVHELVRWSGLDCLPPGSRILDVGCGIGGSARLLALHYGFDVVAISISPVQIARARALTSPELAEHCRFAVMDAQALDFPDRGFDAVWSVEAAPHMPYKQRYVDELLRMLRPHGRLAIADWNRRDPDDGSMDRLEIWVMRQLLDQWAHPEFASINAMRHHFDRSPWAEGLLVESADWTIATVPSWRDSILEGFKRPAAVLGLGPKAVFQGLRETPTLLLMDWAFRHGLMQFGVFRGQKPSA